MITEEWTSEPLSRGSADSAFSACASWLAMMAKATSISSRCSLGFLLPR